MDSSARYISLICTHVQICKFIILIHTWYWQKHCRNVVFYLSLNFMHCLIQIYKENIPYAIYIFECFFTGKPASSFTQWNLWKVSIYIPKVSCNKMFRAFLCVSEELFEQVSRLAEGWGQLYSGLFHWFILHYVIWDTVPLLRTFFA